MKKWFRSRTVRVPIIYLIFSVLWIVITDQINFVISADPAKAVIISMAKGILYVTLSSLLIYVLLRFDERQEASLNTELKVVQDSFSSLFDRNPLPIWMHDPRSGQFLAANQAACRLYGYSIDEFRELKCADICDPAEYKVMIEEQARGTFYLHRTGPWQQVLRGGHRVHVEFFPIRIQYAGRDVTMMTVFDLSQQREIEEELKTIVSERDDYEAFSFSVSHDLRAPLRAITGLGGALLEDHSSQLDDEGRRYLRGMIQSSQEMNLMIDNLLILSRLKRGSLNSGPVDLARIAGEIMRELQRQDPGRRVQFSAPKELVVTADSGLMKPLLTNLLENAWKYTTERDPAVIEFGSREDKKLGRVFFIKDNGLGFDAADAEELFKPFHRSHAVGEYPGMGIGLSIVARIIGRYNGRVWAEGEPGKGAAFYFTLKE